MIPKELESKVLENFTKNILKEKLSHQQLDVIRVQEFLKINLILMSLIPKSHPRAKSLLIREKLVSGFDNGLVAKEGLLAQGRG